jgi:hypothetical protein
MLWPNSKPALSKDILAKSKRRGVGPKQNIKEFFFYFLIF